MIMTYRLLVLLILFVLSGCHNGDFFGQRPNEEQQNCLQMCIKKAHQCRALCRNNCQHCQRIQAHETKRAWCDYRHERKVMGDVLLRQLNSYKDPLQCQKVTCDCQADAMVCSQSCRGLIRKSLTVPRQCRGC